MAVHSGQLRFSTDGEGDVVDLTEGVASVVASSGIRDGVVSVFVPGSTAAITAMEYEPGGVQDLREALAHAHIRAAIVGPSETLPLKDGRLGLGTSQQIVLVDFDDRPRQRTVVVQVLG